MELFKKKIRLLLQYIFRIVFVKNRFKVSFFKKVRANLSGGFLADQWILYDLDNNDRHDYLSEFDWYRTRFINEPFSYMLNNKLICNEILQQYIRVPEIYLIKINGTLKAKKVGMLSCEDAVEILKTHKNLFLKVFGAGKGLDVNQFTYSDNRIYINGIEKTPTEYKALLESKDNWFICEGIEQHPYADSIYDKTLNTMRIITIRNIDDGNMKVTFAVQRIGIEASIPVDNGSRGGLAAKIDLQSGTLSHARSMQNKKIYRTHPDSGNPIEGVVIPDWPAIEKKITELADLFPYLNLIAWDVLLTGDGPCIIEANNSSGVNILQLWGGLRQSDLGKFFVHYGAIKK